MLANNFWTEEDFFFNKVEIFYTYDKGHFLSYFDNSVKMSHKISASLDHPCPIKCLLLILGLILQRVTVFIWA